MVAGMAGPALGAGGAGPLSPISAAADAAARGRRDQGSAMLQSLKKVHADLLVIPRVRVAIGASVWAAAWLAAQFPLDVAILLFAPLVIVPLARGLIPARGE